MAGGRSYISDGSSYAVVDLEVGAYDSKIRDMAVLSHDNVLLYHGADRKKALEHLSGMKYICGHNVIHHDAVYLFMDMEINFKLIDTLYLSPLLFPERPYHRLVKDEKLQSDQINNPANDCIKARELFIEEVNAWFHLPDSRKWIYTYLLYDQKEFSGFLNYVGAEKSSIDIRGLITKCYKDKICENAPLSEIIRSSPCELAFALAIIDTNDRKSITPRWVLHHYPKVENVKAMLRSVPCSSGCTYCKSSLDIYAGLKRYFGFDKYRTFDGATLQEQAVNAAVQGKSLLAIFPTGGGKSLTFQVPALMSGEALHGLTVVISPLQSLMKDQVDNLVERGIFDAVTINGLLDPIERALALQRVQDGEASLLYISPEMLRSKTIERVISGRHVVRFVIDEAHCFSSWGQDFRVDYLYIGKFIAEYVRMKGLESPIPVSCFTATAKQKVIQDIKEYFNETLGLELELFASESDRTNLRYAVIHAETESDKYYKVRSLLLECDCPAIVYTSRTRRTVELATKLTYDGIRALPFHGKLQPDEKAANQDAFISDKVRVIVATSAFGMGVDKKNVGLVVHYDISDSLENYVQEAGRAGRDPSLEARCYVLYCDDDLNKHFILLNQTKLSFSEIQQIWRAVKELTKQRHTVCCSALEIARQAGWDDSVSDMETRVRTAISVLEQGGYLTRGNNVPHVYATGIMVKSVDEARLRISSSPLFEEADIEKAVRIIKSLISKKNVSKAQGEDAESRVDYLADILGIKKSEVISVIQRMRQDGILADSKDMNAFMPTAPDAIRRAQNRLLYISRLEQFLVSKISESGLTISRKVLNEEAMKAGIHSTEKDLRTLLYFLVVSGYIGKTDDGTESMLLTLKRDMVVTREIFIRRIDICRFILDSVSEYKDSESEEANGMMSIRFSVMDILKKIKSGNTTLFALSGCDSLGIGELGIKDVEEALLYLSIMGLLKIEGGFMVIYSGMEIHRVKDSKSRYRPTDYRTLDEFYKHKIQQIHIVGEYANIMVRDYKAALQYVHDYFRIDYKTFISKYFKGERADQILKNISANKYKQIFGSLSVKQKEIIDDKESKCIVVAAGPGSGKTRVLVHKLASLLMLEDVKHEQMLMLTFSRSAATEFRMRLRQLVGNAANYVTITTFHSYCFDILGRVGNIEEVENVVGRAVEMIAANEAEPSKICKSVLVIDEAQDMGVDEYALVMALIHRNDDLRVIAVGDDDQNIYSFRGSDSTHLKLLSHMPSARFIEMTENYRSASAIVSFANGFCMRIPNRMKTAPLLSVNGEKGYVEVITCASPRFYKPIADSISSLQSGGSVCVLTQTNKEALIMDTYLKSRGIRSRLVQSIDGFRFCNLAEVRYFLKRISEGVSSCYNSISDGIISDDMWRNALEYTEKAYAESTALPYLRRCVEVFHSLGRKKYLSDLRDFLFESSLEDFCGSEEGEVIVSTIHKAKGSEYDTVYMAVADADGAVADTMRKFFVGITRAKKELRVYTRSNCFYSLPAHYSFDTTDYEMPQKIALHLTHRDVVLNFFTNIKHHVLTLRSGDSLKYDNYLLLHPDTGVCVAKLSSSMRSSVAQWEKRGYRVKEARVRFIVAWREKDSPKELPETAVLLPELTMCRT